MFIIAGIIFLLFILVYAFLTAAVIHHLRHYTLPGWTAARIVVPVFFALSAIFFIFAAYFLFKL